MDVEPSGCSGPNGRAKRDGPLKPDGCHCVSRLPTGFRDNLRRCPGFRWRACRCEIRGRRPHVPTTHRACRFRSAPGNHTSHRSENKGRFAFRRCRRQERVHGLDPQHQALRQQEFQGAIDRRERKTPALPAFENLKEFVRPHRAVRSQERFQNHAAIFGEQKPPFPANGLRCLHPRRNQLGARRRTFLSWAKFPGPFFARSRPPCLDEML